MAYIKDISINYNEVDHVIYLKNKKRTSSFFEKIKKHKIITASIFIASILTIIDAILIMNFINVLENF